MKKDELQSLLQSLTLEEKIGQLVQLSGEFYNASDISLGPQRKLGITQRTVDLSGSVLNVAGAENVHALQKAHLEKSEHGLGSCQEDNQIIKVFMHILERHDFDILSASCRLML
ncbi:hypothetical protein ACFQ4L_00045, partial [Lapidilactobacillus mulanensis]